MEFFQYKKDLCGVEFGSEVKKCITAIRLVYLRFREVLTFTRQGSIP